MDSTVSDIVSLKQLAESLGMDRSHARRWILKKGFTPGKRRTPDAGGALAISFTREQAEQILALRKAEGFLGNLGAKAVSDEYGVFYLVQLIPEHDPRRIKLGFANDLRERLSQHRTASPTAKELRSWPSRRAWERTIIDALTATNCRLFLNEVFEFDNVDDLIERANRLFAVLPNPAFNVPVSEKSPLKQQGGSTT